MRRTLSVALLGAGLAASGCSVDAVGIGDTEAASGDLGGPAEPPPPCSSSDDRVGPRRVRRLSHIEYGHSVRAVVGRDVHPETSLSLDTVVDGYENDADALTVSSVLASQYRVAAEDLAELVRGDLGERLPCSTMPGLGGESARACAEQFVRDFGGRAFRRPLADEQVARYLDFWEEVANEDGFDEGIFWVVATMLQSPSFLYRTELGTHDESRDVYVLTPHEVASQLSYLITAGPPDAALLEAIGRGDFEGPGAPDAIVAEAERMLLEASGGEGYADFAESWLGIRRPRVQPDPDAYAALDDPTRLAMRGEMRRTMAAALRDGDTLADLFSSRQTFVTPQLAVYYGLPNVLPELADDAGFVQATLPPQRAGILARGRVLTVYADPAASAPVQRGKMVRERLLCQSLPPPPPGVDANPIPPNDEDTTRERHAQHTQDSGCFGCHKFMDPLGFGFEHFDGIARWRDTENDAPIDASGEIHQNGEGPTGTFDGVDGLSALLADSPHVHACYVEQWTQFAAATPDEQTACLRADLEDAFVDADGQLDALLYAFVGSRWFRERR